MIGFNPDPITNFYNVDRKLGDGWYGCVYLATQKFTGLQRAIKLLPRNKIRHPNRLKTEIDILIQADHPNIIKLFETFEDARNVYLVLEPWMGGELFETIIANGKLTERIAARVF
jgi:calcium-dependent protein kinase